MDALERENKAKKILQVLQSTSDSLHPNPFTTPMLTKNTEI